MKKTALVILLSLVMTIGISAPSFAKKKVCRLGHVNSPASIFQFGALAFKEAVEQQLPDWTVEVYPAGQIGGTLALIQGLTTLTR